MSSTRRKKPRKKPISKRLADLKRAMKESDELLRRLSRKPWLDRANGSSRFTASVRLVRGPRCTSRFWRLRRRPVPQPGDTWHL